MDLTKIKWAAGQLVPRTYWTTYGIDGEWRFVIWRMWLGRCYSTIEFPVASREEAPSAVH